MFYFKTHVIIYFLLHFLKYLSSAVHTLKRQWIKIRSNSPIVLETFKTMKILNLDTVKHIKAAKMSGRDSMARGCTKKVYAKAESRK